MRETEDNTENNDAFKFTPPGYIKNIFVGIGKWGPGWVMAFMVAYGGYLFLVRDMDRQERREDALIKALSSLSIPILEMQGLLNEHMNTSKDTQLFISVACAQQANTSEAKKACYNAYLAQALKDRETKPVRSR